MPGIFIGLGGIGGSIVSQVRQALNVHVAFAGNTPAAQSAAGQFQFLLIDTWQDGASKGFDKAQVFDFPTGKDKFGVDERIDVWYNGGDPTFRNWWPDRHGYPQKVGDFASGAGQLRIKGKLAYRIALTGPSPKVVPAVQAALREIDAVRGPATGLRPIPVYLVCSLGGGTGSGMVLTFAQHLRQELPNYCSLIGVFPLAGITEMGPGGADQQSIWANTDAALREIDHCQRVTGTHDNTLTPFFQWPGDGHVLYGKQRPFEYCYLFGRENQNGLSLGTFSEYLDLVSETLIAESFSDLIDEGLPTGISGPHSQFVMQLLARPEVGGQATTYASAAVGALAYPADRIARHLARRYGIAVLNRMVEVEPARITTAAEDFVKAEKLLWNSPVSFRQRLHEQVENRATARLSNLPVFPKPPKLDKDTPFQKASQEQAAAIVNLAKTELDDFVIQRYAQHLQLRRKVVADEYAAADGGIRTLVHTLLVEGGPTGLGLAHAVVGEIRRTLEEQFHALNELIDGNDEATVPVMGRKQALAEREGAWSGAVRKLDRGFGSGLTRAFNRGGKEAKETFLKQAWQPYYRDSLELQDLVAGRATYRELLTETERVHRALGDLIDQVGHVRKGLERSVATDIGRHGKAGVLDLAVMDDPALVAYHFDGILKETVAQGADACAEMVTTPPEVKQDDGNPVPADGSTDGTADDASVTAPASQGAGLIRRAFDRKLAARSTMAGLVHDKLRDDLTATIVADGERHLGDHVRSLSVWEALAAECAARLELELTDAAVSSAIRVVEHERAEAERAGAPPKDREEEILRYFIHNKLFECQKMVRPFWNLDSLMTATHGHPYHFTVIAADRDAYREAGTRFGIDGVLESTAASMQAGTPKWLPGRDRIVLYTREGVAPLFYLNDKELKHLRDAAAQKGKEKFLYTDRRFAEVIDPVIRPREDPDDTHRFAIALALQLGLVTRVSANGDGPSQTALRLPDGAEYPHVLALDEALRAGDGAAFLARVNAEMERIKVAERDGELQQALNRARRMHQDALIADRPAEARWWKQAEQTMLARMTYGQYAVTV